MIICVEVGRGQLFYTLPIGDTLEGVGLKSWTTLIRDDRLM